MSDTPIRINPEDLVALDDYTASHPVKIDLVYAQARHPDNMFGCAIYRPDAKMWCHKSFAPIILRAAELCFKRSGYIFELKDCLRTTEAQALMAQTEIVRANPQWLEEPGRLLSPPGKGGHPRGMAVDIILLDKSGAKVDMGTEFDYLTTDRDNNPAARNYTKFSADVLGNRRLLEDCMMLAASELRQELLPLPQEWWDFRFMPAHSNLYVPISDVDMPLSYRMTALKAH
ncbi:MAG: M15 family metallopeptidase [Micavibrio sp.]|nr:M15 family metallopeptidase [Micavibrio sp.]